MLLAVNARAEDGPGNKPAPIRFLLSFDDGPNGSRDFNTTAQVLDTLAKNSIQPGIKALFFIQTRSSTGGSTDVGKQMLQREQAEGHLLGFHTSTPHHSNHRYLSDEALDKSLQDGVADLTTVTGVPPKLVRPPFWSYDERTLLAYQKHGMRLLLTDLSANDGKVWGINFSMRKRSNMLSQLKDMRKEWLAGSLPVVDGCTPIVVTFHDINSYTANNIDVYLKILVDVAAELEMPTTPKPFYDDRSAIERAALARTVRDGEVRQRLPGIWDWLWQ